MTLLVDSAIKVSVILTIALATTSLLRRRSAAVRHWVLSAAIFCAAITPALGTIAPSWHVQLGRPLPPQAMQLSDGGAPAPEDPAGFVQKERSDLPQTVSIGQLIGPAWIAGVAISVAILLIGLVRLAWLASRAQRVVHGKWIELAEEISREYHLRRDVVLLQSNHPTLLVTWGLVRPKVILPSAAGDWSADRVRVVLCHELAHIRRQDWFVQIAAELLRSAYWFNPLLWITCSRLRQESEYACDDAVLTVGVEGPAYATHLLSLARAFQQHRRTWSPAPAIARPSGFERRISAMLDARLNRESITRSGSIATAIAFLTIAVSVAGFGASARATSIPVLRGGPAVSAQIASPSIPIPGVAAVAQTAAPPVPIARFGGSTQTTTGTISGTVFDETGGVLPGVALTLTFNDGQRQQAVFDQTGGVLPGIALNVTSNDGQREQTTDGRGRFEWKGLSAGDYLMEAQLPGFLTSKESFTVAGGQTLQRNITLRVGMVLETISVRDTDARPPVVDTEVARVRKELDKVAQSLKQLKQATEARRGESGGGTDSDSSGVVRVGGSIRPPRKVNHIPPQYPQHLRNEGIEGVVVLRARIGPNGRLTALHVVAAAHPDLAQAAIDAVNQWQFEPTRLNGLVVETPIEVTVDFRLTQQAAQATMRGVVKDNSGAVLAGVTVEAEGPALVEKVRTVVTDGTGEYRIGDLPAGTYTLTFTMPGFATLKREGIELSGSFTATINANLRVP